MVRKPLLITALAGLAAAVAGAAWIVGAGLGAARTSAGPRSPTSHENSALRERVAEQERELTDLRGRVDALEGELEAALRSMQTVKGLADSRAREPVRPSPPDQVGDEHAEAEALEGQGEASVRALQELALDATRPSRDRILAARRLWYLDLKTGLKGSLTPEIVDAQLALLQVEPDADLRRQICFNVLDRTEPRHAAQLLGVLASDGTADVRAQAADSLQTLLRLPHVRSALEWASLRDPSELVRSTAAEMLARWDGDGS